MGTVSATKVVAKEAETRSSARRASTTRIAPRSATSASAARSPWGAPASDLAPACAERGRPGRGPGPHLRALRLPRPACQGSPGAAAGRVSCRRFRRTAEPVGEEIEAEEASTSRTRPWPRSSSPTSSSGGSIPGQGVLVVFHGAKALRKAVRDVLGERTPVQRCVRREERNVLEHLPEWDRPARARSCARQAKAGASLEAGRLRHRALPPRVARLRARPRPSRRPRRRFARTWRCARPLRCDRQMRAAGEVPRRSAHPPGVDTPFLLGANLEVLVENRSR